MHPLSLCNFIGPQPERFYEESINDSKTGRAFVCAAMIVILSLFNAFDSGTKTSYAAANAQLATGL